MKKGGKFHSRSDFRVDELGVYGGGGHRKTKSTKILSFNYKGRVF